MKNIRRTFGIIVGLMLSLVMLNTQVYAEESIENVEEDYIITDSFVSVNPIYADVISEEELAELIAAEQEEEEEHPGLFYSNPSQTFTSIEEIGAYLKEREIARDVTSITLKVSFPVKFNSTEDAYSYISGAISIAEQHNGIGTEGDYLRFNRLGESLGISYYPQQDGLIELSTISYSLYHLTSPQKEAEITEYLNNQVYPSLSLNDKSDVEKIKAIYGYITEHVTYDWDNLNNREYEMKYTTYAALINGTAVCQGYSSLLYRMMNEAGIDARIITSRNHAWNIVRIGNLYYNVDSTWDSNYGNDPDRWEYYLLCNSNFENTQKDENGDHQRDAKYRTSEFYASYPMSDTDFDGYTPSELNGIAQGSDGNWYLYENGNINYSYSALYNDATYGWWLVENGQVNFGFNDLYCDPNVGWWKISGGSVDFGYSDLYESPTFGWWKINGGAVDFGYTDLYGSPMYGWWKINGGVVDFSYTDLYESPTFGWWKINGGAVDFWFTDLYESPYFGWWKINGGAVDFWYTDLYESPTFGWWKVTGGAVDFGYSDLYGSPAYGWWLVSGGAVDFGYTDLYCSPSVGWWLVNGGAVDFGYNDVFRSPVFGDWKVAGGAVDFGYNGVYNSQKYGRCYVRDGAAVFNSSSYTDTPTRGQQEALKSARSYLELMSFSRKELYGQLTSQYGEGFLPEEANYAIEYLELHNEVSWYSEAVEAAESYLDVIGYSRRGLYDQMTSEYGSQFLPDEANYAISYLEANNLVDWYAQAVKVAEKYLESMSYSRQGLYSQLTSDYSEKFTAEQAEYALQAVGY